MSDYINRQAVLKNIEKIRQSVQMLDDTHRAGIIMNGMYLCEEAVRNQPPAQKKGEWILSETQRKEDTSNENYQYICSCCGFSDIHAKTQNVPYCWHCGARMEVNDGKIH